MRESLIIILYDYYISDTSSGYIRDASGEGFADRIANIESELKSLKVCKTTMEGDTKENQAKEEIFLECKHCSGQQYILLLQSVFR